MPLRRMASLPSPCAQTNSTGTSGQVLTCQRALVNTDHADDAGTISAVTSTMTPRGSASAAFTTASRNPRYVDPSSTPSVKSTEEPEPSATVSVTCSVLAIGRAAHRRIDAGQAIGQHRQRVFGLFGLGVVAMGPRPGPDVRGHPPGQFRLLLQAAHGHPQRSLDFIVAGIQQCF